jgi:hypothetical protein
MRWSLASIAEGLASTRGQSPHHRENPIRESADPGDNECQPDAKRCLRPNAIKNVSEIEHDTNPLCLFLPSSIVAPRHSYFDGQHIFAAWCGAGVICVRTGWALAPPTQIRGIKPKKKRARNGKTPQAPPASSIGCHAACLARKRPRAFFPSLAASAMLSKKPGEHSTNPERPAR